MNFLRSLLSRSTKSESDTPDDEELDAATKLFKEVGIEMERRDRLKSRARFYPYIPWLLAAVFAFLWTFNIARAGLDPDRIGTVGQFMTGLGAIGALVIAIRTLIENHRLAVVEKTDRVLQSWFKELDKTMGIQSEELTAAIAASRQQVVVLVSVEDDDGTPMTLNVSIHNHSQNPLISIKFTTNGTRKIPMNVLKEMNKIPQQEWADDRRSFLLGGCGMLIPGESFEYSLDLPKSHLEAVTLDQLNEHREFVVKWSTGSLNFTHREYLDGTTPARKVDSVTWSTL